MGARLGGDGGGGGGGGGGVRREEDTACRAHAEQRDDDEWPVYGRLVCGEAAEREQQQARAHWRAARRRKQDRPAEHPHARGARHGGGAARGEAVACLSARLEGAQPAQQLLPQCEGRRVRLGRDGRAECRCLQPLQQQPRVRVRTARAFGGGAALRGTRGGLRRLQVRGRGRSGGLGLGRQGRGVGGARAGVHIGDAARAGRAVRGGDGGGGGRGGGGWQWGAVRWFGASASGGDGGRGGHFSWLAQDDERRRGAGRGGLQPAAEGGGGAGLLERRARREACGELG